MLYFIINVAFLIVLLIPIATFFLALINLLGEEVRKTAKPKVNRGMNSEVKESPAKRFRVVK